MRRLAHAIFAVILAAMAAKPALANEEAVKYVATGSPAEISILEDGHVRTYPFSAFSLGELFFTIHNIDFASDYDGECVVSVSGKTTQETRLNINVTSAFHFGKDLFSRTEFPEHTGPSTLTIPAGSDARGCSYRNEIIRLEISPTNGDKLKIIKN